MGKNYDVLDFIELFVEAKKGRGAVRLLRLDLNHCHYYDIVTGLFAGPLSRAPDSCSAGYETRTAGF